MKLIVVNETEFGITGFLNPMQQAADPRMGILIKRNEDDEGLPVYPRILKHIHNINDFLQKLPKDAVCVGLARSQKSFNVLQQITGLSLSVMQELNIQPDDTFLICRIEPLEQKIQVPGQQNIKISFWSM